jgi:tetratricopeptide (TPR) repeat protein
MKIRYAYAVIFLAWLVCCPPAASMAQAQSQDLLTQGLTAQAAGKHDQAVELFRRYLQDHEDSAAAWRYLAASLNALGRKTETLKELDTALGRHPRDTALLLAKAKLLADLDRRPEAIQVFNQVLNLDAENAEALKERGDNLAQEGQLEEALQDLDRAVTLAPKDPWGFQKRGMVKFCQGRYEDSVADFGEAIRLRPEIPFFYFARGQVYLRHLNDRDKAVADFQEGCRLGQPLCCRELENLGIKPPKE